MDPTLRQDILDGLARWNQNNKQTTQENRSDAAKEQDLLGWDLTLEGAISKKWRVQQAAHWKTYKSRKSSKRWMTEFLKRLMNTAWDMWQHRNRELHEEPDNRATSAQQQSNKTVSTGTGSVYNWGNSHETLTT